MKRVLSLVMVLTLIFALAVPTFAAGKVQLSPQKLSVNGSDNIDCEKYNIDGSNYFKLRDLAYLLSGTENQFEVGYSDGVVSITTGKPYTANGSELVTGKDKSSTAVVSKQTIIIDGVKDSSLAAYNIGGNNYFKLRDLGNAVGFNVDFNSSTNTAIVSTGEKTTKSMTVQAERLSYWAGELSAKTTYSYDKYGNLCKEETYDVYEQMTVTYAYEYDANGYLVMRSESESWDGYISTTKYTITNDSHGNPIKEVMSHTSSSGDTSTNSYEYNNKYDSKGNLTSSVSSGGEKVTYVYDSSNRLVKSVSTYDNSDYSVTNTYEYDSKGNLISEKMLYETGEYWLYKYEYANGKMVKEREMYYADDGSMTQEYTSVYTYDSNGLLKTVDNTYINDGIKDTSKYVYTYKTIQVVNT